MPLSPHILRRLRARGRPECRSGRTADALPQTDRTRGHAVDCEGCVTYVITHRSGAMETDAPLTVLDALVAELDQQDDEHPDISVSHESGWTLSAFPSGRVLYENFEELAQKPQQIVVDRWVLRDLLRALAIGDLRRVESEAWQPYEAPAPTLELGP